MNNDLTQDERREWARTLYTTNGKNPKEVAATVNIDEARLRQWIKQGSWDMVRRSLLISKTAQMERLYSAIETIDGKMRSEGVTSPKDVDLILKYTAIINNLETDYSNYAIIAASEEFISWMHRRDLKLTKLFTTQFDTFIRERYEQQ